jgi:BirA family transcriptional regulator, biotin operon repressor / biotin---[acetyl-CoA-carboxylase] ligase
MSRIGSSFYELSKVESTNNYAMAQVHEGMASHGMAVFAHDQTAGKGQRGKRWFTEPGSNIIMSIVVDTAPIRHFRPFSLSVAVALACHDLMMHYVPESPAIKWPNDIYWGDRKAGGILIENVYRGKDWQWAVIGIGINVNQTLFREDSGSPVSLRQLTGLTYDVVELAKELCGLLEIRWRELTGGTDTIHLEAYHRRLYKVGQSVRLLRNGTVLDALIQRVDAEGYLVTGNGEFFSVGEVEWVQ